MACAQGVRTPSRVADPSSPLRQLGMAEGTLTIADEASCSLEWLREQPGMVLYRPSSRIQFLDPTSHAVLDLEEIGPLVGGQALDREVLGGTEANRPARRILVRVPEDVVQQRHDRMRAEATRRGRVQAHAPSLLRAR